MKWVLIIGLLVAWYVVPPLFSRLVSSDYQDMKEGIHEAYEK